MTSLKVRFPAKKVENIGPSLVYLSPSSSLLSLCSLWSLQQTDSVVPVVISHSKIAAAVHRLIEIKREDKKALAEKSLNSALFNDCF